MIKLLRVPFYEVNLRKLELKMAMAIETNPKQNIRYSIILMILNGDCVEEIEQRQPRKRRAIYECAELYKKGGIEALTIKKQPGRPRKQTPEQEAELAAVITEQAPSEGGFDSEQN